MAKLQEYNLGKVLMLYLLFVFFTSTLISATHSRSTRKLLELRNYDTAPLINKNITFAPNFSSENQTMIIKTTTSISIDNSSAPTTIKAQPQKPNSKPKKKEVLSHDTIVPMLRTPRFFEKRHEDEEDEEDLVAELRELTSKFQETFIPDMERISQNSKTYIQKYDKEFTNGYFGTKYALIFILILPLILLSLILTKLRPSFSLLRILLLLIHLSLSSYFAVLSLSSLLTGLEPLGLFYAASLSAYVCVHVMQTLGYALYLLLLLVYLVLVFSTGAGPGARMLGLAQTLVGFAVGLHWYVDVLHRAVLGQPPRAGWGVHAVYATCFAVIGVLGRVGESWKKGYLEEGGEEGKMS